MRPSPDSHPEVPGIRAPWAGRESITLKLRRSCYGVHLTGRLVGWTVMAGLARMRRLLLAAVIAFLSKSAAFTVDVPSGEVECFTAVAGEGEEVFGNYEVLTEADYRPLVVRVMGPENKQIYESPGKSEATFSFVADKGGSYELCISNGNNEGMENDGITRVVGFSFRTDALVDEDIASEESIRRIIELGNQLTKGLSNLLDHQSYMRQREELHAETMESISSKVLIWTIAEALVLVGVAVWQVLYISKFFEVKRMI